MEGVCFSLAVTTEMKMNGIGCLYFLFDRDMYISL